ncbi:MAG: alpha/beta fold hydrolase [Woeseiaceae bacterium]|nr:alpha/beta fold hydrolase [Woeseiaceae bacterium]
MAAAIRKSYTDGRHGQLHCRGVYPDDAERPSVVCLHMSPKSGRGYHELLPELAADGRIAIAPDYPGHGESYLPADEPPVTIEDFAAAVWEVIDDRIGTAPVHLVGYHTGSMVAIEAARQRPEDVLGIVNIAAPKFTDEELAVMVNYFQPIPIDEEGTRFRILWERIMKHRGPGMTLQMAADSMAENLRAGDLYECGHMAAFAYAPRYVGHLAETPHPLLVMNPRDDTFEATQRIDPHIRNGRRVDFPDWGHGFLNVWPREAAGVMLEFFREVEAS